MFFWLEAFTLLVVCAAWVHCVRGCVRLHKDLRQETNPEQRKVLTVVVNLLMFLVTVICSALVVSILYDWSHS